MKNLLFAVLFLCTSTAFADEAKIQAIDESGETVIIRLVGGQPFATGTLGNHVTIKEFRNERLSRQCYEGAVTQAEDLIKALVEEANGDGDSFAELIALWPVGGPQDATIKARVLIEDEAGANEFDIDFARCN